jgi:glycosyltransferase involved in cell wall biosynthesis
MSAQDKGRDRRISILLATYNGQRFLDEQMASLASQDWPSIDVWASDDGSADGTLEVLGRWQRRWTKGAFRIAAGPRAGFVENFRSLMANRAVAADLVAFCDQDDIWDPGKISNAVAQLDSLPPTRPALYCSRTRLVDESGKQIGLSPLFRRPPDFRNAIVQSIAGGNTMIMNSPAFVALSESARRTSFVAHDWWTYILVTGIGGTVLYDPAAHIAYRQHDNNLVGDNMGPGARLRRLGLLFAGRLVLWNTINLAALETCADLLNEESRNVVEKFARARRSSIPSRLRALRELGIHRQTSHQDLALLAAAAIGKI